MRYLMASPSPASPRAKTVAHRVGSHQTSAKSVILLLRFMLLSALLRGHRAPMQTRPWAQRSLLSYPHFRRSASARPMFDARISAPTRGALDSTRTAQPICGPVAPTRSRIIPAPHRRDRYNPSIRLRAVRRYRQPALAQAMQRQSAIDSVHAAEPGHSRRNRASHPRCRQAAND